MDLSIIIVNWNSTELAKACIASLVSTIRNLDYEIIVVDNASDQDNCRDIVSSFPFVTLLTSDHNLGFARANNFGAERVQGRNLLFLNPDTIVLGNAIERMVLELDCGAGIGALGCRLLNRDLSLQTSCVQSFPTITNQLFAIDRLQRWFPDLKLWGKQALFTSSTAPVDVDVVSGACIMVRRELFERVGRFSPEYFMYAEEIDLCRKIRSAGLRICFLSSAQIVHLGGQSSEKRGAAFADVEMRDSVFRLLRKFRGNVYANAYRLALSLSAVVRVAVLIPFVVFPTPLRARVRNTLNKWRWIAAWGFALAKPSTVRANSKLKELGAKV